MKSNLCGALLSVSVLLSPSLYASSTLWRDVPPPANAAAAVPSLQPRAYRVVALDTAAFRALAATAPLENVAADRSPIVMSLPMPDGSFADFWLRESPIIDAELAAQLPDVKTYVAQSIDDPAATARLDWTASGFHALVLSPAGNVYIDPYAAGDTELYISYLQSDYVRGDDSAPFSCTVKGRAATPAPPVQSAARSGPSALATGQTLRTFRLAVAATGEYTAYHSGQVIGAQNAIITTINRVNAIYERDLAVRMTLVNNSGIVYPNAGGDPFSNTDNDLDVVQATIDRVIGSANYDIGHLFGTGGGGVAMLGVVCYGPMKAQGLTGSYRPEGDAFDVDYVAHEIGHQFGADHSFNGTTGSCGGYNRWQYEAYEPGSGSTIMGYAGICGSENLQAHSDPYFHGISLDMISGFLTGATCAASSATGNSPPVVSAGPSIIIPRSTPFYLTGSASDANGDTLTYAWEEFDNGSPSPPNTDDGTRPILRSFSPSRSATRIFPRLTSLFSGTATFGESLPTTSRQMKFRLTVRDNRAGAGAVDFATRSVNVAASAGPFTVNRVTTAWQAGTGEVVTWNVAGTTAPPVNCANVKIALTFDGYEGEGFVMVASTPNDGTSAVTVPDVTSDRARVRVDCVTSPFFNVSMGNFSVLPSVSITATATTATSVQVTWPFYNGATSYDVYRRSAGTDYVKIGFAGTTSYTDLTAAPNTAYLYKVYAKNSNGVVVSISNPDLATTFQFEELTTRVTALKAAHIMQLRQAVNAVRALAAAGETTFTDPDLISGQTSCKGAHITELRDALDAARISLRLPPVTYAQGALNTRSTVIAATHLTEIRSGVR